MKFWVVHYSEPIDIVMNLSLPLLDQQIHVLHELEADAKIDEQETEAISGVLNFLVDLHQSLKERER